MNEPSLREMRRMGIIDLMLITTAVAFVFMLHGAASSDGDFELPTGLFYASLFANAMTLGLVLPAIYWIPKHYARTGKTFSQPGHWMLGAQFLTSIWSVGFYMVYVFRKTADFDPFSYDAFQTFFLVFDAGAFTFQLAAMIFLIIAAIKLDRVRWKVASIFLAVSFATCSLNHLFQGLALLDAFGLLNRWVPVVALLNNIVMVIASIAITAAAVIDWRSTVLRDWLHRIGLVTTLASLTVLPLLQYLQVLWITQNLL